MVCKNCNAELSEDALFCGNCGTKVEISEPAEEPVAQEEAPVAQEEAPVAQEEAPAAQEEAPAVQEEAPAAQEEAPVPSEEEAPQAVEEPESFVDAVMNAANNSTPQPDVKPAEQPKKAGSGKKKAIIGVAIGVVAVLAALLLIIAIVIIIIIVAGSSKSDPLVYLRGEDLYTYTSKEPLEVEEDVYNTNLIYASRVKSATRLSPSGKYLFYPVFEMGSEYDLYRVKVGKKNADAEKVDSDISSYVLLGDNELVYLKDDGKLYHSTIDDKTKIASDVDTFWLSEDNKNVLCWEDGYMEGSELYVQDLALKKDKIKIDSDVTNVVYHSSDFKVIVYREDKDLYVVRNYEDKEKIESDVSEVYARTNNGKTELYFLVEEDNEEKLLLSDLIDDDLKAADDAIEEPDIDDYKKIEESAWWGQYETTDWDAYDAAYDVYYEKVQRDWIRESLAEATIPGNGTVSLKKYSIDSKKTEVIKEEFFVPDYNNLSVYGDVCIYNVLNIEDAEQIKFSEIVRIMEEDYYFDSSDYVKSNLYSAAKTYIYVDGKETLINIDYSEYKDSDRYSEYVDPASDFLYSLEYDSDSDTLYYIGNVDFEEENNLYKMSCNKPTGTFEMVYEDVESLEMIDGKNLYYLSDCDEEMGELYCNGERIDSDVVIGSVVKRDNRLYYKTDLDDGDGTYSLTVKNGSKTETISEDVYMIDYADDGRVALITDYKESKEKGTLYVYVPGKDLKMIDEDARYILIY